MWALELLQDGQTDQGAGVDSPISSLPGVLSWPLSDPTGSQSISASLFLQLHLSPSFSSKLHKSLLAKAPDGHWFGKDSQIPLLGRTHKYPCLGYFQIPKFATMKGHVTYK